MDSAKVTVKAVALIIGDDNVKGSLQFVQHPSGSTHVTGRITGLSPGLHGFHIHALGDTTNGCNSTGPHFNPLKKDHGSPTDDERHAGDLGNIIAAPDGVAEISIRDGQIPLSGVHSIIGRAVVVHADPDDLGRVKHDCWQRAMQEELKALQDNQAWDIVQCPNHVKPIGCKWVYSVKLRSDGSMDRYKQCCQDRALERRSGRSYVPLMAECSRS